MSGRVEMPGGLVVDFDGYEPRIGPDGEVRWWALCSVVPIGLEA